MGKFRGWHFLAGIAAMVVTGILGTVMGLNNTAAFMAGCVAFVGVALWTDSRISRRREKAARQPGSAQNTAPQNTAPPDPAAPEQAVREQTVREQAVREQAHGPAVRDDR